MNDMDLEEDCGFKFRRVSKEKVSIVTTTAPSTNHPTDSNMTTVRKGRHDEQKKEIEVPVMERNANDKRRGRRRSSFAAIASRSAPRPSSFSVSLSTKLPPSSVHPREYHKHLLPDLPGPIKMRQLLIWAVQKASTKTKGGGLGEMAEGLVQALFTNKVNTSWYQRPTVTNETMNEGAIPKPGPKNQEISDCLKHYRLKAELVEWQRIKTNHLAKTICPILQETTMSSLPAANRHQQIEQLSGWLECLPKSIDQLQWTLSVASSFERHAHSYCESVFQQIRAKYFGGDGERPAPILLMRALTTAGGEINSL